jgi:putative ABC transport system permease protein
MLRGPRHDLWLALRGLARRPGFSAAAIATLALGIGASTAIFSVAFGVSLRPLDYPSPDRLIRVYEANPANGQREQDVAIPTFHAWREGAPSIESAALFSKSTARFLAGTDAPPVTTMSVSPGFFGVLGIRPLIGSGFKPESAYTRFTADKDAVISYSAWQRLLGGRPDVVGQTLEFSGVGDNDVYRIVGVMPQGFSFAGAVDLWRPTLLVELPLGARLRLWRYDGMVARLRPGRTLEGARAELSAICETLARDFPRSNAGWTVNVESLHDSIVGDFGRATWMLLSSVAVVLIVTCLNVGGLLTARAVARRRETAVRVALGASSWRLLRLPLCEAAVLGLCGGAAGLLLAWSGVAALRAASPPGIPRVDAVRIDAAALAITALATIFSVFVFAAAPSRFAWRDINLRLRSTPGQGGASPISRTSLAIAQCAGATTLVVLALLLTRSFQNLMAVDLGWAPGRVLSLSINPKMPPELRRPWYRYVQWSDELIARLEATLGVERAAITTQVPLSPSFASTLARGRGKASTDAERWPGVQHSVTDGYFQLMGIRLLSGRTFGPADRLTEAQHIGDQPSELGVAVVSESAARTLWPDRSAIGQALWLPDFDKATWREVVGVVEDIQFRAVGESPALHVFVPWTQYPTGRPRLLVKTRADAAAAAALVRGVAQEVSLGSNIDQVATLDALVSRATAQPRFTSRVVAAFGALALLLAGVGIYGTLSFMVGSRIREIGIRLALGASRQRVMRGVLWRGLAPAAAGAIAGAAIAVMLGRVFRALLFNVTSLDPVSLVGAVTVLLGVATLAAAGPAALAARTDPSRSLRAE